jgi:hypothetical protein
MGHVQSLADELRTLADASGRVKEKDEARVNFILGELKEALGEEYTLTDGVIQNYDKLKESIDKVIQSKTVNSMLEAKNADYTAALDAEAGALNAVKLAYDDFTFAQSMWADEERKAWEERDRAFEKWMEYANIPILSSYYKSEYEAAAENWVKIASTIGEKETAYNKALQNYGMYTKTIEDYEEAQRLALEGNTAAALELLKSKGDAAHKYSDEVDAATREAVDSLFREAVEMGRAAEKTRANFEAGVEGYTKEMVDEAEKGYEDALEAYANAYADAELIGEDLGDGLSNGMEAKRSPLVSKAKSLVNSILDSMNKAADRNSPSKETMDFGEDLGEGTDIGLESKTKDLMGTARKQVNRLLDAYQDEGEDAGPQAIRSVSAQAASKSSQFLQGFANSSGSKLDKILAAIERGQVLVLDGDAVVGGTADRMNRKLGQDRELVARGAK